VIPGSDLGAGQLVSCPERNNFSENYAPSIIFASPVLGQKKKSLNKINMIGRKIKGLPWAPTCLTLALNDTQLSKQHEITSVAYGS
jgi:hypothetical protein